MDTIALILEHNPGLINIIVTGVILPVAILMITNRHSRKIKETEKELNLKFKSFPKPLLSKSIADPSDIN